MIVLPDFEKRQDLREVHRGKAIGVHPYIVVQEPRRPAPLVVDGPVVLVPVKMDGSMAAMVPFQKGVMAEDQPPLVRAQLVIVPDPDELLREKTGLLGEPVVIPPDQVFLPVQLPEKLRCLGCSLQRQVLQNIDLVLGGYPPVSVFHKDTVHLLHAGKGAFGMGDDVLVVKIQVCGKIDHALTTPFPMLVFTKPVYQKRIALFKGQRGVSWWRKQEKWAVPRSSPGP